MNEQRCDLCEKECTCPKSAHFENYSLAGCYQFVPRTGERFSMVGAESDENGDSVVQDDYDPYTGKYAFVSPDVVDAAEDTYNNTIRSLIEATADRNDLARKLREAYKMILDLLKGAETSAMYVHVLGLLDKLNKEYSEVL